MATDRRVTANGKVFDPDANKSIVFGDANAAVAIGYTGMAYIGAIPTDQWLVEALTGISIPEGARGRGTVPSFMTARYAPKYWGWRVRTLMERLNDVPPLIDKEHRLAWTAHSFDVLFTGFEWNHGRPRPVIGSLSKPAKSDLFQLVQPARRWYYRRNGRFPAILCVAPEANLAGIDLSGVRAQIGDPTNDPSAVLAGLIHLVSKAVTLVGPDAMTMAFSHPAVDSPTIAIRFISVERGEGTLVARGKETSVPITFTPWVVSPGSISGPSVLTNIQIQLSCGRYRVLLEGPLSGLGTGAMSSQVRPPVA